MPKSNQERRIQTRDNLIAVREDLSESPKPTYTIDGRTYKWEEYFKMLTAQIAELDKEIDENSGDGIVEEHTTAWL